MTIADLEGSAVPDTVPISIPVELDVLVGRIAAGDEAAFTALYDALSSRVMGLALRVLQNRALAEETVQEVFLEVWRTASRFDPSRGAARTWVMTMTHHRAVDQVRAQTSSAVRDHRAGVRDLDPDRDVVADRVADLADAELVHAALGSLSAVQREALILAYVDGRTQTEIAALTDTPLGTVKTRMRDALARLRRTLAPS